MHSKRLPPMSGGSSDHEVICIEAKRICDFCFQEHQIERTFTGPAGGQTAECEIDQMNVVCREISRREITGEDSKVVVVVAVTVPVTIRIYDAAGNLVATINETVRFLKQAVLCAPAGTEVDCQISGDCACFIDPATGNVLCTFDFCVVLQTAVLVRVLVPTLGACTPKQCRSAVAALGCPPRFPAEACKDCNC